MGSVKVGHLSNVIQAGPLKASRFISLIVDTYVTQKGCCHGAAGGSVAMGHRSGPYVGRVVALSQI